MSVRYVRDEERIAVELNKTRAGLSDVQRPTGTEKAQTMDVAAQASSDVLVALADAAAAISAAADAQTTSNGKNARRRGQAEPPPPPGGWVAGDQWIVDNGDGEPVEVRVWNGTEFVREQLLASELLILSGGLIRLADGVVTADAIAADAIDSMTITGALIRTAASGQRLQFDINGLRGFNAAGTEIVRLDLNNSGLSLRQDADTSGVSYMDLKISKYNSAEFIMQSFFAGIGHTARLMTSKDGGATLFLGNDSSGKAVFLDGNQSKAKAEAFWNLDDGISAPYASAAGEFTTPGAVAAGGFIQYGVAFPAGRFTHPPKIAPGTGEARFNVAYTNVTATGFTINVLNNTAGASPAGQRLSWIAVQMLKTGATG